MSHYSCWVGLSHMKGEAMPEKKKPRCKLAGENGNIFNLMGLARRALKKAGQHDKAQEMTKRVISSNSYDIALSIICEYVDAE